MSNLPASNAESAGLLIAPEVTLGLQPVANWRTMEPDQDQIGDFYLQVKPISPSPISPERQQRAPEIVDADVMPKLGMDLTCDLLSQVGEGMLLARAKHAGGTGQSFFVPTARTTTDYTVAALGALPVGLLVHAKGWLNAANNGLFVVGAASTATAVKVAGGVAETPSGYLATLEVAGWRGAAGDIGLDANGNLTSTVADFTTMGLVAGIELYIGGVPGTAFAFATTGYGGPAEVATVAAHLVTLKRRAWTVAAADTGATKTIDIYFSRWLRNVATTSADYLEQSYQIELAMNRIGAGVVTEYVYAQGLMVGGFDITAPAAALVKTSLRLIGTFVTDPSTTRAAGASTAPVPLAVDRFNTTTKQPYTKILNAATEAEVATDITSWALHFDNGISGQKQHGTFGNKRMIVGKVAATLDMDLVVTQDDAIKACTANTTLCFGTLLRNANGGVFVNLPALKFTGAVPKFPANGSVTISPKGGAFIEAVGRYTLGLSVFAYLPAS